MNSAASHQSPKLARAQSRTKYSRRPFELPHNEHLIKARHVGRVSCGARQTNHSIEHHRYHTAQVRLHNAYTMAPGIDCIACSAKRALAIIFPVFTSSFNQSSNHFTLLPRGSHNARP